MLCLQLLTTLKRDEVNIDRRIRLIEGVTIQAMVWSAFNGIGLALVIPCVASLIADYHPAESRGQAFGLMAFTSGLGKALVHQPEHFAFISTSTRCTSV